MGIVLTPEQLQEIIDSAVAQAAVAAQTGVAAGIQAAQEQAQSAEQIRLEGIANETDRVTIAAAMRSTMTAIQMWLAFSVNQPHREANLLNMPELVACNEGLNLVIAQMVTMLNRLDPQPPAPEPVPPPEVLP